MICNKFEGKRQQVLGAAISTGTMLLALIASAALVAGCASSSGVKGPSHKLMTAQQVGANGEAEGTPWPKTEWWKAWGDPQLDAQVAKAIAGSPTLATVQARLQQAQAQVDVSNAARKPQVNGQLGTTYQRFSENYIYPPPLGGSKQWTNTGQVTLGWDLDLFGRQRAQLEASIGQLRATEAEGQSARVALVANVVAGYVSLARLVENRLLLQEGLRQRQQVLDIVRQRTGAGLDNNVDLRQSEGAVAQTQVELQAVEESIGRARHALAELEGQGPDALKDLTPRLAKVVSTPLPAGLPADLVGRRADLVAERWRVEAAHKGVDVAKADFYPNINLTAFAGLSSFGFDKFLTAGSAGWGAGPALSLPIFEGGRLRANLSSRNAEVDAAIDGYNAALLRALREVADEVTSLQSLERQQQAQDDALKAAEGAYDLAVQRYRSGLGNFLVVLTADANVITQRRAASDLKARHLASEATLAHALGGGFQAGDIAAPAVATAR